MPNIPPGAITSPFLDLQVPMDLAEAYWALQDSITDYLEKQEPKTVEEAIAAIKESLPRRIKL